MYKSFIPETIAEMDRIEELILAAIGLLVVGKAKLLTPVDKGRLRQSIESAVEARDKIVSIGTNVKYAELVEFGTGVFHPQGRKTPWSYQDEKGNWHRTKGQKAQPYLTPAFLDNVDKIRKIAEEEYSEFNK